jgi:hypothetical protein
MTEPTSVLATFHYEEKKTHKTYFLGCMLEDFLRNDKYKTCLSMFNMNIYNVLMVMTYAE